MIYNLIHLIDNRRTKERNSMNAFFFRVTSISIGKLDLFYYFICGRFNFICFINNGSGF